MCEYVLELTHTTAKPSFSCPNVKKKRKQPSTVEVSPMTAERRKKLKKKRKRKEKNLQR